MEWMPLEIVVCETHRLLCGTHLGHHPSRSSSQATSSALCSPARVVFSAVSSSARPPCSASMLAAALTRLNAGVTWALLWWVLLVPMLAAFATLDALASPPNADACLHFRSPRFRLRTPAPSNCTARIPPPLARALEPTTAFRSSAAPTYMTEQTTCGRDVTELTWPLRFGGMGRTHVWKKYFFLDSTYSRYFLNQTFVNVG